MLRRLEPTHSYRSLSKGLWPNAFPLGRRSVIYSHNGGGKSSFASLLLEIASDDASTEARWEDEHGQSQTVKAGQGGPSPAMAVFTKQWVRRNLSQFLDGATASPIVTLGEEAIEAKEHEQELTRQIEGLRAKAKEADKKRQDHADKARKLASAAQDAIADQLREFDYQRFTLKGFGQFIVLTHDFGLLRLFLKSQKSAWDDSRKKIRSGDADEERFPKAAFLEMPTATSNGVRRTQVAALPSMLSKHTTEYAYLFSKVMDGVADGADHDRLFLLPNAARRVLEVFTSYKAPHLGNFDQRLAALMGDAASNPYRDVYDFCNRYSHGEGSESVDVLDGRVVHGQIRRCMEFLKFADTEHFERMCKATDADPTAIA